MKIAHLADIHYRSLQRHEEYRRAFTKMFEELKQDPPDHICVCGDIYHWKTSRISPELIEQLSWWFEGLADIAPTHVMLGNHDGNLANLERQDIITPIINALNNPNIHLYKKSGLYNFAPGYNFGVYSVFDPTTWDEIEPKKGDINIALYHGCIDGCKTDGGFELEGEKSLSFFVKKGYSFLLLGDIHKFQFLDYRDAEFDGVVAPRPWCGYPGSCIQQNYGEQPDKGYLMWDIRSHDEFDVKFRKIEHDQPYVTLKWEGSLKKTVKQLKGLPKHARFRIASDKIISQKDIRGLHNELKTGWDASEIVYKIAPETNEVIESGEGGFDGNLRDPTVHVRLLKDYFGSDALTPEEWSRVHELVKGYIETTDKSDVFARDVKWSLKKMKFHDIFGYGKDNEIDFERMNGITGIFGSNALGKSAIIGTLMYGLFNTTDRGAIRNLDVINARKKACRVDIEFSLAGVDYRIERQTARGTANNGITSVNFMKGTQDLNGEQRYQTDNAITKRIGSATDFQLTSLAPQGEINKFIEEGPTARNAILSRFLNLTVFEKMSLGAKKDSSEFQAQLKRFPDRDWLADIDLAKELLKKKKKSLSEIETEIKSDRKKEKELQIQLATLGIDGLVTRADVDAQQEVVGAIVWEQKKLKKDIETAKSSIEAVKTKLDKIARLRETFPIDALREKKKAHDELSANLVLLGHSHEKELTLLQSKESSIKKLDLVPCGDKFPTCRFIRDSHRDKQTIDKQRERAFEAKKKVDESKKLLEKMDVASIDEKIKKYETVLRQEEELKLLQSRSGIEIESLERKLADLQERQDTESERLERMRASITEDDELDEKSRELKSKIRDFEKRLNKTDAKRVLIAEAVGRVESDLEKLKKDHKEFLELSVKTKIYSMLMQAGSKKGIPAQIIRTHLPKINDAIKKILSGVVDFTVKLAINAESNKIDIFLDYGDSVRLIELGSGMEKMISSLAIRVALSNVSSLPKSDTLIIDESFGVLDGRQVEACNQLLISLKKWFKNIIIISHVEGIKEIADDMVEITRNKKDSHVRY